MKRIEIRCAHGEQHVGTTTSSNVLVRYEPASLLGSTTNVCELLRFRFRLALQGGRHQRGRSLGDGAARPFESDLLDHVAREPQMHLDLVAAEGVHPFGAPVGPLRPAEVARLAAVVDDDLLI